MQSVFANRNEEDQHKEMAYVIGFDALMRIQFIDLVAIGSVNHAVPVIRECFRLTLIRNSSHSIFAHNHPSESVKPSSEDKIFTQKLCEAGKILDVKLNDYIIFAEEKYFSFSDEGLI
ncbi:DNA repair protein RadC [hydrothermal vent metagenome]|uniref:DNA repair protein RadC n=1 Tax=hydrothermal vent metagenome TaxID=652676 RepID=A0A3B1DBI8_9ZZZZ